MSFLKKSKMDASFDAGHVVTLVGPEAYFQGTLTAKGSMRVDGRVEGSIVDAQTVVVGDTGKITGDISAETVIVSGEVKGNITGTQYVELLSKSKVLGDLRTPRILVEEGAVFDGHCAMSSRSDAPAEHKETKVKRD